MGFFNGFILVAVFWTAVYLLNTFLLECSFTSAFYAKILSKNGISINVLHIKWYTVRCNRLFIKISSIKPKLLKIWFNFGVIVSIIGQIASIFLLMYTLIDFFRFKPIKDKILVPVVS
jgi:hypothetical protein